MGQEWRRTRRGRRGEKDRHGDLVRSESAEDRCVSAQHRLLSSARHPSIFRFVLLFWSSFLFCLLVSVRPFSSKGLWRSQSGMGSAAKPSAEPTPPDPTRSGTHRHRNGPTARVMATPVTAGRRPRACERPVVSGAHLGVLATESMGLASAPLAVFVPSLRILQLLSSSLRFASEVAFR